MHLNALKSSLEHGQWDIESLQGIQQEGYVTYEAILFPARFGRPEDPFLSMTVRVKQGYLKWFMTENGLEWPHRIDIFEGGRIIRSTYLADS